MAILISPEGKRYETDDPREINDLTLGRGYRHAEQDPNEHEFPHSETTWHPAGEPVEPGAE